MIAPSLCTVSGVAQILNFLFCPKTAHATRLRPREKFIFVILNFHLEEVSVVGQESDLVPDIRAREATREKI